MTANKEIDQALKRVFERIEKQLDNPIDESEIMHNYYSENTRLKAIATDDRICFSINKKTIPIGIDTRNKLAIVMAEYMACLPDTSLFKDGYQDAYFCNCLQLLSDANSIMVNGDFGFARYVEAKEFELDFKFDVILANGKFENFTITKQSELIKN